MLGSRSGAVARGALAEQERLHVSGAEMRVERCDTAEDAHVRRLVLIVAVDRVEVRRVAAGREAELDAVGGVARDAVGLELHDYRARDAVLVSHSARGGAGRPPEAREGARQCARRHRLAHGAPTSSRKIGKPFE